jgi:hypothetical protein
LIEGDVIWLLCGTTLDMCHQFPKVLSVVLAVIDDVICNKEYDLSVAW